MDITINVNRTFIVSTAEYSKVCADMTMHYGSGIIPEFHHIPVITVNI